MKIKFANKLFLNVSSWDDSVVTGNINQIYWALRNEYSNENILMNDLTSNCLIIILMYLATGIELNVYIWDNFQSCSHAFLVLCVQKADHYYTKVQVEWKYVGICLMIQFSTFSVNHAKFKCPSGLMSTFCRGGVKNWASTIIRMSCW